MANATMEPESEVDETINLTDFPYRWGVVDFSEMFVDDDYQRPLTSFVKKIEADFNPMLFQVLALSERSGRKRKRFAIIDGQTRWTAAMNIGITNGPCIIYEGLSQAAEAIIFEKVQTERRGVVAYDKFRASLISRNPDAIGLKALVDETGFSMDRNIRLGITALGALMTLYRRDATVLERTLLVLRAAWPGINPGGTTLRGTFRFLAENFDVDDDRLVRRLSTITEPQLQRKAMGLAEVMGSNRGAAARALAQAIEAEYNRRK